MGKRNKKNTRKPDLKTFRTVKARFILRGTTLSAQSKKLGFHHEVAKRSLTGEKYCDEGLQLKENLIRLSKGLPIEEPEPQETTGETLCP